MRVLEKSLSPGMEHREESELRAQMLGVGRNGAQRLADGSEQNVVDDVLILQCNGCDWPRQSEDHGNTGCREAQIDDHPTIGREPAIGILGSGDLGTNYNLSLIHI